MKTTVKTVQQIDLRIENKGHLIGTCGWLKNEVFKDAYLSIRKLKDGYPGIFLIGKNKKGEETKDLICFVDPDPERGMNYQAFSKNIWGIYPENDFYGQQSGFAGHFTDAARAIFDDFIDRCAELLREFWEADTADFEIEIKNK